MSAAAPLPAGVPKVYELADGSFLLASRTRPGRVHRVQWTASAYRCSCEAGVHGRRCWAVAAVEWYLLDRARRGA